MEEERLPVVQMAGILPPLPTLPGWFPKPPKIVSPEVIQTILQDEIAGRLADLCELTTALGRLIERMERMMDSEKFQGRVDTIALSATDSQAVLNVIDRWHYSPLVTAYITNDGPDSVLVAINDPYPWMTIKNSETRTIDHTKARERIRLIYYKCASGETASFRVEGEY